MLRYPESKEHIAATLRCGNLLHTRGGYIIDYKKESPLITQMGQKNWEYDVFAYLPNLSKRFGIEDALVVEIDGQKTGQGHSSDTARAKNRHRDNTTSRYFGLRTRRYPTGWIIGKNALDDDTLYADMMEKPKSTNKYTTPRRIKKEVLQIAKSLGVETTNEN